MGDNQFNQEKNLQRQLELSERKFRALAETATDVIIIADQNSIIVFTNSKVKEVFGYTNEELLGQHLHIIMPLKYRQAHLNGVDRFLKTGIPKLIGHTVELEGKKKNNSIFPIELSLSFWREDENIFFTGIIRDISERNIAEVKLKESEAKFRLLAENSTDIISIHKPDGTILYASPACETILGYKPEELIETNAYDLFHPEDRELMKTTFKALFKGQDTYTVTFRCRKKDGNYIWFESTGKIIRDSQRNPIEVHAANRDISEKKKAEEELKKVEESLKSLNRDLEIKIKERTRELRQSENQLKLITNTLPVLIAYVDQNKIYQYTNDFYLNLSINTTSPVGKKVRDIFDEKTYSFMNKYIEKALSGAKVSNEHPLILKDGSIKNFEVKYLPDRDVEGNVRGIVVMAIDLTDRTKYESNLNRKNEELKRINNDLDNFVYTASHDLKAPIANIDGLISAIKGSESYAQTSEEIQEMLNMIEHSIEKFQHVLFDLTEISKAQRSQEEFLEEINIPDIIDETQILIRDLIKNTQAKVLIDLKIKKLIFSRKNFRSIIYNLLSNAIKYRSPHRTPEIEIKTEKLNDYILLSVKDNGLGIEEDKKDKIFGMFQRFQTQVEGTGIGLYIVKRIVDNSGGKIKVDSEKEKGSTFKIYLKNESIKLS